MRVSSLSSPCRPCEGNRSSSQVDPGSAEPSSEAMPPPASAAMRRTSLRSLCAQTSPRLAA